MRVIIKNNSTKALIEEKSLSICESEYGENMILYDNPNLDLSKVMMADDTLDEFKLSWLPDYTKSQLFFYIHNENDIQLAIEVLPKYLSYKEKNDMLNVVSKEIGNDGYSDYYRLLDMFNDIDKIINSVYPVGIFNFYSVELSDEEKSLLITLI